MVIRGHEAWMVFHTTNEVSVIEVRFAIDHGYPVDQLCQVAWLHAVVLISWDGIAVMVWRILVRMLVAQLSNKAVAGLTWRATAPRCEHMRLGSALSTVRMLCFVFHQRLRSEKQIGFWASDSQDMSELEPVHLGRSRSTHNTRSSRGPNDWNTTCRLVDRPFIAADGVMPMPDTSYARFAWAFARRANMFLHVWRTYDTWNVLTQIEKRRQVGGQLTDWLALRISWLL